jgi:hypothetical protein
MPGRFTAQADQPFVVFMIGMRVNKLLAVRRWLPTMLAMGPMLRELFTHPEKGLLGARTYLGWRQVMVVQYWRSFEDLERFARGTSDPHLPAWQRFNRVVGYQDGSVGIWHESYLVEPGHVETVYGNMPVFGLAAATAHVPARGGLVTARQRLGRDDPAGAPVSAPVDDSTGAA